MLVLRRSILPALAVATIAASVHARPSLRSVNPAELRAALRPDGERPLLVHLMASWCLPCAAEWPQLGGAGQTPARHQVHQQRPFTVGTERRAQLGGIHGAQ